MSVSKEIEDFPISTKSKRTVWYLIVFSDGNQLKYFDTRYLEVAVNVVEAVKNRPHLIFGVWHGRYYTNLFLLDADWLLRKARELGVEPDPRSVEYMKKQLLGGAGDER